MTTIGQSLRHSLARTLRRAALLLERLALGVQPPASSADTPVTEDGAAAAPAGGSSAHWLQRAHRPPPDHWLAHIRRQAPHLLRGDVLNDEAWLRGATPSTPQPHAPAAPLLPAWSAPDTPGAERPSPSAARAPTAPTLTPDRRPPPAVAAPSPRPRLAPQFAERALRLYRTEIAPSDPPTRGPSAPTLDIPSPKASAQPAPHAADSRPAPQVARGLAQAAPDETLSAARRAANAQPRRHGLLTPSAAPGPAVARDGRLPSPLPADEPPRSRLARALAPAAPPPAPAAPPDLHTDAAHTASPAPAAQPDLRADAAPIAPPRTRPPSPAPPPLEPQRPLAATPAPWPSLPPTGASDSDRPAAPSASSEPLWPTLPAWPEPADAEPTPERHAWQHRQRLEREQRGRLWNE